MKMKEILAQLKQMEASVAAMCESNKIRNRHPIEQRDLEQALTLLRSVRRRLKSKDVSEGPAD